MYLSSEGEKGRQSNSVCYLWWFFSVVIVIRCWQCFVERHNTKWVFSCCCFLSLELPPAHRLRGFQNHWFGNYSIWKNTWCTLYYVCRDQTDFKRVRFFSLVTSLDSSIMTILKLFGCLLIVCDVFCHWSIALFPICVCIVHKYSPDQHKYYINLLDNVCICLFYNILIYKGKLYHWLNICLRYIFWSQNVQLFNKNVLHLICE